jgi:hypothetical protein
MSSTDIIVTLTWMLYLQLPAAGKNICVYLGSVSQIYTRNIRLYLGSLASFPGSLHYTRWSSLWPCANLPIQLHLIWYPPTKMYPEVEEINLPGHRQTWVRDPRLNPAQHRSQQHSSHAWQRPTYSPGRMDVSVTPTRSHPPRDPRAGVISRPITYKYFHASLI